MVNVQYYCFLTNIITKTKICESETTFFNFVNLPKREKIPLSIIPCLLSNTFLLKNTFHNVAQQLMMHTTGSFNTHI